MSVDKPCTVEAHEGDVVIERGNAGTSLTPDVAEQAGAKLIEEAKKAREQRSKRD